jgi:glutamine amidotransferase
VTITIVDYGVGNLGSIPNMLKRLGQGAVVTSNPEEIRSAEKLILPGVGAFDAGMRSLRERGLIEPLREKAFGERIPILGLCLGMQLLFEGSEEGDAEGLGWLKGRVVRFRFPPEDRVHRVPHMGWNTIAVRRQIPLVADLGDEPRFYFAHSFHAVCDEPEDVVGVTEYGYEFPACVGDANIMGAQFHPEKSHRFGLKLLANFVAI